MFAYEERFTALSVALPKTKSCVWYPIKRSQISEHFLNYWSWNKVLHRENTSINISLDCLKRSLSESLKNFEKQRNLTEPGNYYGGSDLAKSWVYMLS